MHGAKRAPSRIGSALWWQPALVGMICCLAVRAEAQDSHYWTNQYGTRAQLLGGLVVGSFLDLSSTYYNPGAIAFVSDPSLILTTDMYQYISIDFEDPLGTGLDFRNQRTRPAPGMFATSLPISGLGNNRIALSVLTRRDFSFESEARRTDETGTGEAGVRFRVTEAWGGPTWAYLFNDTIGLGATAYVGVRSQSNRLALSVQNFVASDAVSQNTVSDFRYWQLRALAKLGLGLNLKPVRLGLTVTTPSLGLVGRGEIYESVSLVSTDPSTGFLIEGHTQKDLSAEYRSPLSVAIGASRRFGTVTVFATVEWFDSVDPYVVLDPNNFIGQTTGDTLSVDVKRAETDVLNWGFGVEVDVGARSAFYAAIYTDGSSFQGVEPSPPNALATWDILNLNFGGGLTLLNTELTAGISLGYGNDQVEPLLDLSGSNPDTRDATYFSIAFLVGIGVAL